MVSDFWNIAAMVLVGLLVAVLVYPFLHEGGHSLAAFIVGADVVEFEILPVPYIMCNVSEQTNVQQIIIGISGTLVPTFIAVLIPNKWFWSWYFRFLLLGISLLSFLISVATLIIPYGEIINPQDDILRVLSMWTGPKSILIIGLIVCSGLILAVAAKDKPMKMICRKFGI